MKLSIKNKSIRSIETHSRCYNMSVTGFTISIKYNLIEKIFGVEYSDLIMRCKEMCLDSCNGLRAEFLGIEANNFEKSEMYLEYRIVERKDNGN